MALDELWRRYRTAGRSSAERAAAPAALDQLYLALLAWSEGDRPAAADHAQHAARLQPENPVCTAAAQYLARVLDGNPAGVYVNGEAFGAFIRGGGNVGLYAAVSAALRAVYAQYNALSLLDIGVGDGLALLPALTPHVTWLDLVEPSAALLAQTGAALDARGIGYTATHSTVQAFMTTQAGRVGHWDVIQATWSLQSTPPEDRPAIFAWLRAHGARVLIAEFDVPDFTELCAPERVRYVVERYARGLAEYDGDGGLVAQGFLMPVFFGYFDRTAARTNWEGPLQGWIDGLRAAGFTDVQTRQLFPYFWADAALLDAR